MLPDNVSALARELTMGGLADAYELQQSNSLYIDMPFSERLAALLIAERERRQIGRMARMMAEEKLPVRAAPEELVRLEERGMKPEAMSSLLQSTWIPHAWNALVSGETGMGKTWIACCIATAAIRAGYRSRYYKVSDLLYGLSNAMDDGVYLKEREKLTRYRLIILDDFGKSGMSEREKNILFDLLDDRSGKLSTIIVGQRPYNDWHSFIDNPIIADAVLDRLSRERFHIRLRGDVDGVPSALRRGAASLPFSRYWECWQRSDNRGLRAVHLLSVKRRSWAAARCENGGGN